ncbi:phenylalanine--tRNA ligase alpha subunit isoform X2 [Megachile rotundata]|uniref:phenylalanine--tRNA ligase alpha subunit isoform X2 n=1 Tax=Megachile rotundata TaxID=143995 RepID=UPI003FD0016E
MTKELTDKILDYLDEYGEVNSLDLADIFKENHQKIVGAIKSLETVGDLITTKQTSDRKWELTSEGQHIINHGSHEAAVYNAIPNEGIPQSDIMQLVPFAKIGFSKALSAGWIQIDKSSGTSIVRKKVSSITDVTQNDLKSLSNLSDRLRNDYKRRKLIQETVIKSVQLGKGQNFSRKVEKLETELTADLLANGAWKDKKFKPYNFSALGAALEVGHLHPLLKVRSEFKKIFLEMGFTEMPTNNFVESSFWNFDALFQPQQHPARDAHDTFFISEPSHSKNFPMEYLEKVKKVHSEGGYGSLGYCYDWKIEEAEKNVLRTHTTAVSARMLYKLMQQGDFIPVKYFSIDRVFRNETLDATHLAEFHQIEGVIADYNLTLGDLIGILYEFFKKLGITQLRFKPAYNPYTEPSMEIFCYHDGLNKWIEIGNSGMFRPEMLLPMGIPENVNVIAWGLSLERPTMIKYGLNNIRDLVGPKVDLEMVYNNPICRLNKYMFFTDRRKLNTGLEVWLKNILPQHTQNINSRPYRVKSMAYGLAEHCRILWNGSPTNEWTCMTVLSDHSYGIRSDIFFSFPVLCKNRTYEIVQDLVNDEYIKKYIKAMSKLIAREVYFALTICNLKREN